MKHGKHLDFFFFGAQQLSSSSFARMNVTFCALVSLCIALIVRMHVVLRKDLPALQDDLFISCTYPENKRQAYLPVV